MRRAAALVLALLACAPLAMPAGSFAATPKTTFNDVEDEVMCVVCGTPLDIAGNAPQAQEERQLIRELVAQGKSKSEIKAILRTEYGDRVLALPDDTGFNLAVYLVPVAVVAAFLALLLVLLPRWRRRTPSGPGLTVAAAGGAPLSAADEQRLADDLARHDG